MNLILEIEFYYNIFNKNKINRNILFKMGKVILWILKVIYLLILLNNIKNNKEGKEIAVNKIKRYIIFIMMK